MRAAEGVGPYEGERIVPCGDQARLWMGFALFMRRRHGLLRGLAMTCM